MKKGVSIPRVNDLSRTHADIIELCVTTVALRVSLWYVHACKV